MTREIRQRLKSRSFAITTGLLVVGVIASGVLSRELKDNGSTTTYDVAVVGELPGGFKDLVDQAAAALDLEVHVGDATKRDMAESDVRSGGVDVAIDATNGELISNDVPGDELAAVLDAAWQGSKSREAAAAAGLDEEQIDTIVSPAALHRALLHTAPRKDDAVGNLVGTVAAVLLFMSINVFGGLVLTGVVEEKTTGVVEVLLAHVRAHQLLTGKVLGIGTVAMAQMSATIAAGLVALRISGRSVPRDVWVGLPTTVLWFVLGFVLYSTLFALAGSFVSRQEDAQGAAAPITVLFTAGYLTVFALGADPYSTVARVVSVLPPFAPLLMPLRVAVGAASVVEIVIAAVGLLAATLGMLRLSGSVYARTLLHRGSRLKWKQALRMRS